VTKQHEQDLKGPDSIQNTIWGGWHLIEHNAKLIAALVVVGLLAGIGSIAFQFISKRQERAAQEAYYAVETRYNQLREGFDKAKLEALMPSMAPPAGKEKKNESKPASGQLDQDYGSVIGDLEKVARDHTGTTGGAQAALILAETYLSYNQPDKAVEIAQLPAKSLPAGHLMANLAKVLWGNALAAKGNCQEAVGVWQQVIDNKKAAFLHPDVSLRSGICYESLSQPEKAAEMYRKVTSEAAESIAGQTAKGLLRAIELKSKPPAAKQG